MQHFKKYALNYLACLILISYGIYFYLEGNVWRALVWLLVALAMLVPVIKNRK